MPVISLILPEIPSHQEFIIKFALEHNEGANIIRAYEPGKLEIQGASYSGCVLVSESSVGTDLALADISALSGQHLRDIATMQPQVLLIGTGEHQVFPAPRTFIPLMDAQIGFEVMDTAAACRTYNVLLGEGRNVYALLFV
ncbi:MAG: Mth938-like domain-containing protein [bacterium]